MKEMSRMIKQFLLAGAILMAPLAMAQGEKKGHDKDPQAMAEKMTERMTTDLQLTPDQVEKVKLINQQHAEKKHAIREAQVDKEAKKASMAELREWRRAELAQVLTAEQMARMEELRKQRKTKHESDQKEKKK